jgi:Holliday junction resolvase RusA-like endonuclease
MSGPIRIVLLGEPVAMARARITKNGNFTPAKQRNTMAALRIEAQRAMHNSNYGLAVFDEPLRMDLRAEFAIPKRMHKQDQPLAMSGNIRPAKRPDIDNLYKLAADALNGVVYRDDALIVEANIRKVYSGEPKIVITVQPVFPETAE